MDYIVKQLEDWIEEGKLEVALKKLHTIFSICNSNLKDTALLLLGQLTMFKHKIMGNLLSFQDESVTHARLISSVISLKKEIEETPEQFIEFINVDLGMDKSVAIKANLELSNETKDALFERISYIKSKSLNVNAIWIDDFPSNNTYECKILKAIGIEIDCATSSDDAYQMIKNKQYELILSDVNRSGDEEEGFRFHKKLIGENIDIPLLYDSF